MKKILSVFFYMMVPTLVAYGVFFLLYNTFRTDLGGYHWLAVIPFVIVTGYIVVENKKEWKVIQAQR